MGSSGREPKGAVFETFSNTANHLGVNTTSSLALASHFNLSLHQPTLQMRAKLSVRPDRIDVEKIGDCGFDLLVDFVEFLTVRGLSIF